MLSRTQQALWVLAAYIILKDFSFSLFLFPKMDAEVLGFSKKLLLFFLTVHLELKNSW